MEPLVQAVAADPPASWPASRLIEWAVLGLVVWTPVQNSLTRAHPILPSWFVWLDESVVVLMLALVVARVAQTRTITRLTATDLLLLLFVLVGALSVIVNGVPLVNGVAGGRSLLQYVPVYYLLARERITETTLRRFGATVVAVGLLQVAVTAAQLAISYATTGVIDDDGIVGTFNLGQANTLSYYTLIVALLLLGALRYSRSGWHARVASLAALAVPFVAGSSRAALLLLPVVLLWCDRDAVARAFRRRRDLRRALGLVVVACVGFGLVSGYLYARGFTIERISPRRLLSDTLSMSPRGNGGRLLHVAYTFTALQQTPLGLAVGMGPGMYTSGAGYFLNSPGLRAINDAFGRSMYGARYHPGMTVYEPGFGMATFGLRDFSQLTNTFGEWGGLGLLAYVGVVCTLMTTAVRTRRCHSLAPSARALAYALDGTAALTLLTILVLPLWEEQATAFLLWSLAGLLAGYRRTMRRMPALA